jgi:hypothetical protein
VGFLFLVDVPVLDFEMGAGPEFSAYHWAHKVKEMLDTDTNINWRGEWDPAIAYEFRDAVRWRPDANTAFSSYYCIEENAGTEPPDIITSENVAWSLMVAGGENGLNGADSTVPGPPGAAGPLGQNGADATNDPSAVDTTAMLNSTVSDFITFGASYRGASLSYAATDDSSDVSVLWNTYSPEPPSTWMALSDNSDSISSRGTLMRRIL